MLPGPQQLSLRALTGELDPWRAFEACTGRPADQREPGGGGAHYPVGASSGLPFNAAYQAPTGPGRVDFSARDDDRLQSQHATLAFDEIPTCATIVEIQGKLDALLAAIPIGSAP